MTVPIGEQLTLLCDVLGIEKTNVKELTIHPGHVTAIMFKVTDTGSKYIDADSDQAAIELRLWNVTT